MRPTLRPTTGVMSPSEARNSSDAGERSRLRGRPDQKRRNNAACPPRHSRPIAAATALLLTHVDQSCNMKLLGFAEPKNYRHQFGTTYFLRRNPQPKAGRHFTFATP